MSAEASAYTRGADAHSHHGVLQLQGHIHAPSQAGHSDQYCKDPVIWFDACPIRMQAVPVSCSTT